MEQPDDTIHQPVRLRLMAALNSLPERGRLQFTQARAVTGSSDGNLGAHIARLERAGYIGIEKDFVDKRPRTRLHLTKLGRRAFEKYRESLLALLGSGAPAL